MKPGTWFDLAFCIAVLPALLLIFPIEEWAGWNAFYVAVCILWSYLNYFLHRRITAPLVLSPRKNHLWIVAAIFFISAAVTFLVSLHELGLPRTEPGMDLHQRALWVFFVVSSFCGVTIGILDIRLRQLEAFKQAREAADAVQGEVDLRGSEAVGGEEITVKSGYQLVHVPLSDIQYAETRGNYVCIHRDHGDDVVSQMTMKSLMDLLPEGKFLRVHRSFLIPAWRIESRSALSVRLVGVEREIPVGRAHKENLN